MDNRPLNDELLLALAYFGTNLGGASGSTGVTAYPQLSSKPSVNNVELVGNKTLEDLGIAENLQDFFDVDADQSVTGTSNLTFGLIYSTNSITFDTTDGLTIGDGTNGFKIKPNGEPVFTGVALQKWFDTLETACVNTVQIPTSGWSNSTTSVEGVEYYINVVNLTKVYEEHPDVNIDHAPSKALPTEAEREAFTLVASTGYFVCDKATNKLTCYSQDVPTSDFYVFIKGAK